MENSSEMRVTKRNGKLQDTISPFVNKESTGCLLINKIVKEPNYPSVNKESSGCLLLNKIIKINTEI